MLLRDGMSFSMRFGIAKNKKPVKREYGESQEDLHKPLGEQATQPVGQLLRVVTRFRCSRFLGFAVGFVVRTSTDRHFFVKASAQRKELF